MESHIAVFGAVRFPPERIKDVLPHLKAMVEATRRLDGCIAYDVAEDVFEPGLLRVSELWPDLASLQRHTQAPHIAPWHEACRACAMIDKHYTLWKASPTRLA
jgi:quinol monooxygenase YgiN